MGPFSRIFVRYFPIFSSNTVPATPGSTGKDAFRGSEGILPSLCGRAVLTPPGDSVGYSTISTLEAQRKP